MLTQKQKNFCHEYVNGADPWNATAAALAAGYSHSSARMYPPHLLRKAEIIARIAELSQGEHERYEASRADAVERISSLAMADARGIFNLDGSPKLPHEIDDATAALITNIDVIEDVVRRDFSDGSSVTTVIKRVYKYKLNDRGGLRMLAEHLNLLKEHQEAGRPTLSILLHEEDKAL